MLVSSLQQNNLLECNSDGFANSRVSLRLTNFTLFLFFSQCFESDFHIFFARPVYNEQLYSLIVWSKVANSSF
jgi:hypothetical protein